MKRFFSPLKVTSALLMLALALVYFSCSETRPGKPVVLVFSKTAGFKHASIPLGIAALQELGRQNNFDVDTTKDASYFQEDSLKKYSAVIFLNTTGDVLNVRQEAAFERYIQSGGGFVGVHAATDTEYDWKWYGRLIGAYFNGHPQIQPAKFIIKDKSFGATSFFKDTVWQRTDELYNFKGINPDLHILITIDETSYEGGTNGSFHPMSWYHDYDGGRAFYTELGHVDESYTEENYLKHLLGGIQYAIGDNKELDYAKAKSQYPPDDDRFVKTQLALGEFYEPTEMTILPNFDVLIVQRRGEILLYKNETHKVKQVGFLDVYYKTSVPGVNAEEGILGLAKDPDYAKNNWVYIYYSPAGSNAVNRLSRFTFKDDTLINTTEKVILDVKSQREICCHTGGSIAFGPDGLLYFSAGDNSTPFDEKGQKYVNSGFGPMNDTPGHEQYDARRSSSNTNDLRGKINRIRVKEDGSYEIPEGNLFPKGTPNTRPEIYVMGNRNPYRISVDQKNSNLYWGEVGPDAASDSLATRGPRGYDELNQARKAGYFGWPLFVGNNYPYHQYDYVTGKSGELYDAKKPINNSKNNTGITELPPLSPAFIWYPYGASPDFPQVGTGGRNAMAGPVYYTDLFPKETRLPDYYNNKLIIYDWIRGWIKAVTMLPNGDFDKMEPFAPTIKVNSLIDMEVGPDGKLYLLEYGNGWFTKNADAGLARIDFINGNRPPKISSVTVNKTSGTLPFQFKASADVIDREKDAITYKWNLGNGETKETTQPEVEYTYTTAGDYTISVEAIDSQGASVKSTGINIYAGNEEPKVTIQLSSNQTFYFPGKPVQYSVQVKDEGDSSPTDPANFFISTEYVEGFDKASSALGHQQGQAAISGKNLMLSLDCKSCHKENEKSIGPSYKEVANRYSKQPNASNQLTDKILKGGSGNWGEVAMPAHATLARNDAQQIVGWILSLDEKAEKKKSLPPTGTITSAASSSKNNVLVLSASYTDKGGNNIKALTGSNSVALRNNNFLFTGKEKTAAFTPFSYNGVELYLLSAQEGWLEVKSIDLTSVTSINVTTGWQEAPKFGFTFELHLDKVDGKIIGSSSEFIPKKGSKGDVVPVPVENVSDGKLHTLYVVYKPIDAKGAGQIGMTSLQFNAK